MPAAAVRKPTARQEPAPVEMTTQKIRDQIPAHYFKQNHFKSGAYLCRDLAQSAATAAVMWYAVLPTAAAVTAATGGNALVTAAAYFVAWNLYAFVQGLNWTGIWVLAHECGHRSFSPSVAVNDAFGIVLHSALLVPYHSWRISHGNHHKHTNHLEKDTVFVPDTVTTKQAAAREAFTESPIVSTMWIIVMLVFGWPGYLIGNMTGQKYEKRANHFEPTSPLFRTTERPDVVKSDIGLLVMAVILAFAASEYGAANVALWYGMPYLWVNAWLVFITYLQHSDVRIPHYTPEHWNFVRGALSTVDRDFGAPINWWLHHINDSHVVHHLFSTMPFYNAIEVTRKHIKPIVGDHYVSDTRTLRAAVWESWTQCRVINPADGVAYFKQ
jgi:omega-6 fatty acid desaturase / acyl-lipid omega-6 desaturase (Delta-12 desaturase)